MNFINKLQGKPNHMHHRRWELDHHLWVAMSQKGILETFDQTAKSCPCKMITNLRKPRVQKAYGHVGVQGILVNKPPISAYKYRHTSVEFETAGGRGRGRRGRGGAGGGARERESAKAWSVYEVPVTSHETLTIHCPPQSIIILSLNFLPSLDCFFDFTNFNESFRVQIPGVSRGFVFGRAGRYSRKGPEFPIPK